MENCVVETNDKIEFSTCGVFVLFSYIFIVWLCEVFDVVCFSFNLPQTTLGSRIIVGIVYGAIIYFQRKRFRFQKNIFSWQMSVGIFLIIAFGFVKGILPDMGYDTGNYHLISQEPGFVNYFSEHFGLGHFQVWGFRLGDRLFYLFRRLFGLRMGTQFNTVVLVIVYIQIVNILHGIRRDISLSERANGLCELFALLVVMSQKNLMNLGSYYVDIIAFPVALEVLFYIEKARSRHVNSAEVVYFATLNGFWFAFKMTNIVYIVPAIIIFVVYVKKIDVKTLFFAGLGCALPCSVYLVFNSICTGNPIFPYFNSIFQSIYFSVSDFKDTRWGAQTIQEKLLWIFYAIFKPEYRQSEIHNRYTLLYGVGVVFAVLLVIVHVKRRCKKQRSDIYVQHLVWFWSSSFLWSITTGYERYYMFGMMLAAVIGYDGILLFMQRVKRGVLLGMLLSGLIFTTVYQGMEIIGGREWAWRDSRPVVENTNLKESVAYVFNDVFYQGEFDVNQIEAFAISEQSNMGYAHWMNDRAYVINLNYFSQISDTVASNYYEIMDDYLERGKVYDIQMASAYDESIYAEKLQRFGLTIDSTEAASTNIGDYIFIKLRKING